MIVSGFPTNLMCVIFVINGEKINRSNKSGLMLIALSGDSPGYPFVPKKNETSTNKRHGACLKTAYLCTVLYLRVVAAGTANASNRAFTKGRAGSSI